MNYELLIAHGDKMYAPVVEEGIAWSTERKGVPSKLTFKLLQDDGLEIEEGDAVRFKVDGQNVFFGFIFQLKRSKTNEVQVTAYDQLRYLKNKDSYVFEGKTASQIVQMIAADFNLQVGEMDQTGYVIPSRVEDNSTLFDMIQNALDLEMQNTGELFVLYDDFGKMTLRNIGNLITGVLIDAETAQDLDYSSSIDSETYDQIKLYKDNKTTGKRELYITKSGENINKWGVLQYFESLQEGENGQAKADALLRLYNQKTKTLQVKDAFGDVRVRAGVLVPVILDLGDMSLNNLMLVEKASHTFSHDQYTMTLTLRGGLINGQ